ncbi:MAG: UDP-N-acetylmuramoyl-tripeptide--D-alanyl-D-alanine ligase [Anaerolineae bacterium]
MMLTLADAIEGLTNTRPQAGERRPISGVVVDSRQVQPGALFVALPGERTDGHAFVADAFRRGAIAAIIDRDLDVGCHILDTTVAAASPAADLKLEPPLCLKVANSLQGLQALAAFWRRKFQARVIGITGSVGKTSTKELAWAVLSRRFKTLKSPGNMNNEIGLPLTLLQLDEGYERVILEMGMYDLGEIALLCDIAQPQVGLVTNIGPVHLERLKTIERITQAKTELVENLPQDGQAILNYDDARVRAMRAVAPDQVFTYGLSPQADLWAGDITSEGLKGIRFVLHHGRETRHARAPLLGRHSVHTALGATAIGLAEGLSWEEIMTGLTSSAIQLRLVAVPGPKGSTILDDTYNASPASTIAALNLLAEIPAQRRIAVLADMMELGDYEIEGHRKVGCRAAAVVDLLLTLGPRARHIASEALACGLDQTAIREFDDPDTTAGHLLALVEAGDVILVKGSRALKVETIVWALSQVADAQKLSKAS